MRDKWDFYFATIEGNLGSIFVNLAYGDVAPVPGVESLLRLTLKMRRPRPDGLSSQDEYDVLVGIEAALSRALASDQTFFVGRVTHSGVRDVYFYTADSEAAEGVARRVMKRHADYQFEMTSRPDPAWEAYSSYLFPSPRDQQAMANRGVLESLEKSGDTLTRPREIDHWAYFSSAASRDAFLRRTESLGYEIRTTSEANANENGKYGAQVFRVDVPDQNFDSITLELFDLAGELDGEYDGWESPVEKSVN